MVRARSEHPTELELLILKVLWDQAPLPVRDIRQRLAEQGRDLAHTTVITTLNTMFAKQFLKRTKRNNAFWFSPRVSRDEISSQMLGDVVNRVFEGSASAVVLKLFDCSEINADEIRELRRLLNRKFKEQEQTEP